MADVASYAHQSIAADEHLANSEKAESAAVRTRETEKETNGAAKRKREEGGKGEDEISKKPKVEDDATKDAEAVAEKKGAKENEAEAVKLGPKEFESGEAMFNYSFIHSWPTNIDINKSSNPPALPPRVHPLADSALTTTILDFVQQAARFKQLRKGAVEVKRALRQGIAEFVVLAADAEPLATVLSVPVLAEAKKVPYVFLPSKEAIGEACGIERPTVACCVTHNPDFPLEKQMEKLRATIDKLLIVVGSEPFPECRN